MKDFAVFWGCTIPARFPFIEKATRVVLDDLGARSIELEGHTCCPEGTLVKANDENAFYTAAARNLAIVEKAGLDLVTPCNGCYSTFKETPESPAHALARGARRSTSVSPARTCDYKGELQIFHFAEWLSDQMGAGLVASKATKPFWGMRIAVHYGCHLLRPQPAVRWDDPLHPTKVEALVAALGAHVVDYATKMQCCGGALDRVGERDASLAFARRKLTELQDEQVDALIVVCPSCFQQFDLNQAALQRAKEDVHVPVLYLSELIGLAYGHEPDEIGLGMHRVSRRAVPRALGRSCRSTRSASSEDFDVALLGKCYSLPGLQGRLSGLQDRYDRSSPPRSSETCFAATSTRSSTTGSCGSASSATRARSSATPRSAWPSTFRKLKEIAIAAGTRPRVRPGVLRAVPDHRRARQAQGRGPQEARPRPAARGRRRRDRPS